MAKRVEIVVQPGTNPTPDQTQLKTLHYTATDKVFFYKNNLRKIPGWTSASFTTTSSRLWGAARSVFSYISGLAHTIIGTNVRLYTYENGVLFNITPVRSGTTAAANSLASDFTSLGNNPFATTNGSRDVVVTSTAHKLAAGDSIAIASASTTNGIPNTELNATHIVRSITTNTFTITVPTTAATSTGSGGGASVTVASALITMTSAAHGLVNGDRISVTNAGSAVGGVPTAEINIEHKIRNVTTNTLSFMCVTKATSAVTGGGGAGTVYQKPITKGAIDFSQGVGYGGGLYGVGLYGVAKTFVNAFIYPRIWSFGRFGNDLIGTPGDQLGVYIWEQDTTEAPTLLSGAPTAVNWVFVSNNAVVTLGASGVGNRIKASDVGDATNWTISPDSLAYEDDVEGAGTFISQAAAGTVNVLFTESEAYTFRFVGDPGAIYEIKELLRSDGLIGPKARAMIEDSVIWMGQAIDIYLFDGGSLSKLDYITCRDYIAQNLNYSQRWKIFTRVDTAHNSVWIFFPTGSSNEPNEYVIINYVEKHATLGTLDRTAAEDPIAFPASPYMVYSIAEDVDGVLYRHDNGHDDDTQPMLAFAETNYAMIGEGDTTMEIVEVIPDSTQTGNVDLTIFTKEYPQDTLEGTFGPFVISETTTFIDPLAEGTQRKYRFEQNALGEDFQMGKWFERIQEGVPI